MQPVGNNDTLLTRFVCWAGDQVAVNVRYWTTSNLAGGITDQDIADSFYTDLSALYPPLMGATANFYGVSVQIITNPSIPLVPAIHYTSVAGTATGDLLPTQTAGVITLRTAKAGRKFRGRVYVPFPAEGSNDTGTGPNAGYVTDLGSLKDWLVNTKTITTGGGANTIDLQPVLYHRLTKTWDNLVDGIARLRWGTQRRRGGYGQQNPLPA